MGWVALSSLCKWILRPLHPKATLALRTVTCFLIEVEGTLLRGTEGMVLQGVNVQWESCWAPLFQTCSVLRGEQTVSHHRAILNPKITTQKFY